MKLKSLIMFSVAALAFAACSNDNEAVNGSIEGNGVVEVKLTAPVSRAVDATTGKDGDKVTVKGDITVTLYCAGGTKTETITEEAAAAGNTTVKFWDVTGPTKVTASVNNGGASYAEVPVTDFANTMPEAIPAYGESSIFTPTGTTEVNNNKTYEMYSASVAMSIPVARLEVSGITHVDEGTCKYAALTIDGIYLDKIKETQGATSVTDYHYPAVGEVGEDGYIPAPILWEAITAPNNFLADGVVWPAAVGEKEQAYAFNFYPNENLQMPIVKIYFEKAEGNGVAVAQPRYAMIKSYNNQENFKFEAGKIYRIKDVELADKNIIGDEEGNTLWGVNVTVIEAEWTVVDLDAEWVSE